MTGPGAPVHGTYVAAAGSGAPGGRSLAERAALTLCLAAIRLYQWTLSPFVGGFCRYQPTCSRYTAEALRVHGLVHGLRLGAGRILRCHPWGGHGYDPVPVPEQGAGPRDAPRSGGHTP